MTSKIKNILTPELSKIDYFFLYLCYPSAIKLTLVEIGSNIKCPNMRGFISLNDYEKYKKQKDELEPYYTKIKNTKDFKCLSAIISEIKKIESTQTKFISYHLSSDNGSWCRNLI